MSILPDARSRAASASLVVFAAMASIARWVSSMTAIASLSRILSASCRASARCFSMPAWACTLSVLAVTGALPRSFEVSTVCVMGISFDWCALSDTTQHKNAAVKRLLLGNVISPRCQRQFLVSRNRRSAGRRRSQWAVWGISDYDFRRGSLRTHNKRPEACIAEVVQRPTAREGQCSRSFSRHARDLVWNSCKYSAATTPSWVWRCF